MEFESDIPRGVFVPQLAWKGRTKPEQPEAALIEYITELRYDIEDLKSRLIALRLNLVHIQDDCAGYEGINRWITETAKHGKTNPETQDAATLFEWLAFCVEGATHFNETFAGLDATIAFLDVVSIDLRFILDGYVACGSDYAEVPPTCTERLWAWLREAGYEDVTGFDEFTELLAALRCKARDEGSET